MSTELKALHNGNDYRSKQVMPRPTLAQLREIMDEEDRAYEMKVEEPLAAGWTHMTQSRGWK